MASSSNAQAVETRRATRESRASVKEAEFSVMKREGNEYYKNGSNIEAADCYVVAINMFGPRPVLLSNLAAAYLNLELYEEALWASVTALEFDPQMVKAHLQHLANNQNSEDISKELQTVRNLADSGKGKENAKEDRPPYPSADAEAWELFEDSDTEDSVHIGNNVPCRFYNHDGCVRGESCLYSHAPDYKSVRDDIGKNVCIDFLLGDCKFGDAKCIYSHDKTYLPENGWWKDEEKLRAAKKFQKDMQSDGTLSGYEGLHKYIRKHPKARSCAGAEFREAVIAHLNSLHHAVNKKLEAKQAAAETLKNLFVLVIAFEEADLFVKIHTHLLSTLKSKAKIVNIYQPAEAVQKALQHLDSPDLAGVLLADPGVLDDVFRPILDKLVKYVRDGGSLAIGGNFSNFINPDRFDSFMHETWGLDWKFGSYHRTTFQLNPENEVVQRNPSLKRSYSMKAVHISNIQPQHAIYVPTPDARLQSMVFAPVAITDKSESPAVCARVGKGLLSFLGDVNGEEASTSTVLAMLGVLDASNAPESAGDVSESDFPTSVAAKDKGKHKATQPVASTSSTKGEPGTLPTRCADFVLILTLSNREMFERIYGEQVSALKKRVEVEFATTVGRALEYLALPNIKGVFVADEGITEAANSPVLVKVIEYAKNGGLVVLGGVFPSLSQFPEITRVFKRFDLPWEMSAYTRCELQLNCEHPVAKINAKTKKLQEKMTMKAVFVSHSRPEEVLYKSTEEYAREDSPILHAKVGKGRLGFIGDVNAEPYLSPIILAMFGLLIDKPGRLVPDSQKFLIVLSPDPLDKFAASIAKFDRTVTSFFEDARQKVELVCGLSNARFIELLSSPELVGVLVPCGYILEDKCAYLLHRLVAYAENGGTVVFSLNFFKDINRVQFQRFFSEHWGLDWHISAPIYSMNAHPNPQNSLVAKLSAKLPSEVSLANHCIKVPQPKDLAYFDKTRYSLWRPEEEHFTGPVIFTNIGKGHVGYLTLRESTRSIFYAMVNLL
ncbi:hypothetical protein D9613_003397 [Agrocybe pediades]|uniref:C3H1-type domain-containing protein n=1 Tax=Agrocybe pediades TaxID=84607 RepID=A0A8H4QNV5_9AGAR|nr:hypothetical protein D9613_003397 [Agrocybe pediades]